MRDRCVRVWAGLVLLTAVVAFLACSTAAFAVTVNINLNGGSSTTIVGRQVHLTANVTCACGTPSYSWSVPPTRIAGYAPNDTCSNLTELTDLTCQDVRFYWLDGSFSGTCKTVTLDVTVGANHYNACTVFLVKRPSSTLATTTPYAPTVSRQYKTCADASYYLHLGNRIDNDSDYKPGATFTGTCTMPEGFGGVWGWCQLVDSSMKVVTDHDGGEHFQDSDGLDTSWPYGVENPEHDSPGQELDFQWSTPWQDCSLVQNYSMYLMFQPRNPDGSYTNTIVVPARKVDWYWEGVATWNESCSRWDLSQPDRSINPASTDCTSPPVWDHNVWSTLAWH